MLVYKYLVLTLLQSRIGYKYVSQLGVQNMSYNCPALERGKKKIQSRATEVTKQPLYSLLLDEGGKTSMPVIKEFTQDKIYILKNERVVNSSLKNYFMSYDGAQYIPQPWLREMYPKD